MASDEGRSEIKVDTMVPGILYGIAGLIFLSFSLLHFLRSATDSPGLLVTLNIPSDPIIGMVMAITSILFLIGAYRTLSGQGDGRAFSLVGLFMGTLISFVRLLVIISSAFRTLVLGSEELVDWTVIDDIVPGLYLGSIVLFLLPVIIIHGKRNNQTEGHGGGEGK